MVLENGGARQTFAFYFVNIEEYFVAYSLNVNNQHKLNKLAMKRRVAIGHDEVKSFLVQLLHHFTQLAVSSFEVGSVIAPHLFCTTG